jgi:hypothetical protein
MALVSGSITSLVNGVSQQPAWMRLSSQGDLQENAISSLVKGVTKRPPTEHVAKISDVSFGDAFFHTIDRAEDRRYSVVVTSGNIRVFDLITGVEKTVNKASGYATYLTNSAPSTGFAATTIADFSFIMNKEVVVSETNAANSVDQSAWIYIKQALYNCTYAVYLNGSLITSHTTAATGNAPATDAIAAALVTALTTALGAGWTIQNFANVIRVHKDDNTFQDFACTDSSGNTATVCFKRSIQSFADLPPVGYGNSVVEVTGASGNDADSYWVTYDTTRSAWVETVKPEDEATPTPSSMPWSLRHEADDTFTFSPIDWGWRAAGDEDTNPTPSFVGRTINDIYVHRNRLFILSDQNVIASRPGGENFFEFYSATATTILDTDPIDVALSNGAGATVPIAEHAVAFSDDLLIFTDPAQFRIGGGDLLNASTVAASVISNYRSTLYAKPAPNGRLIHFSIEKGSDSGIREGFIDTSSAVFDAPDITVHVPAYIKGVVRQLASAINFDTLFVLATDEPHKVYLYKWYIENNEKLQSSWSSWVFPEDVFVLSLAYVDGSLYALLQRPDGVYIERIRLDVSYVDPGMDFMIHLDRKCTATGVYDEETDTTTWTLPYDLTDLEPIGVHGPDFTSPAKAGFQLPELTVVDAEAGEVSLEGDFSAGECFFGVRFTYHYRVSQIFVPAGGEGKSRTVLTDGRLQLRNVFFNFTDTGTFTVTVTPRGLTPSVYKYGPTLGLNLQVGVPLITEGRFRVPVRARNSEVSIDITSDSHFPCSILSFDWEGEFTLRSRKV